MEFQSHIYFSTATILNWYPLLKDDEFKDIIISSLKTLTKDNRLIVFAFVIMPNHMHIIWSENKNNRKETVQASFFKFTSHQFLKELRNKNDDLLKLFLVNKVDRNYQFWKRNTLYIEMYSDKIFNQKLDYLHNNPLQPKWQLVENSSDYKYSSASFYEFGKDEFGILTDFYLS